MGRLMTGQSKTVCCALGWGMWLEQYFGEYPAERIYEIDHVAEYPTWRFMFGVHWADSEWPGPRDAARRVLWIALGNGVVGMSEVGDLDGLLIGVQDAS